MVDVIGDQPTLEGHDVEEVSLFVGKLPLALGFGIR